MALVFGDSFDHYLTADITKKWTAASVAPGGDIAILATGALAPSTTCLTMAGNGRYVEKALPAAQTTFIAGWWFRTANPTAGQIIAAFMDSATPTNIHVSVRYDSTGHITVCRDSTVLATSASTVLTDTWYHIEVKATIGDAADSPSGRYEVRVDGSTTGWIADSGTGKDTRNSGNASIGSVRLYSATHKFQHFYILNTTGSVASDFLGPCRFQVLRPVAVGATAEWAGNYADNWQNVTDQAGDSDTTFNQSSTAGQTDQFTMSDVPAGVVHAIQHVIMARRDAGGARTIRPLPRIGSTDYAGTNVVLPATYVFATEAVSVSPATGGSTAWDDDEVNAMQGGYELVS